MLAGIRQQAGLTCGQIAIKIGMPRSTAYSLTDRKRSRLPSNPEQVRAFILACGLTATQVDVVMDCWQALNRGSDDDVRTDLVDHPLVAADGTGRAEQPGAAAAARRSDVEGPDVLEYLRTAVVEPQEVGDRLEVQDEFARWGPKRPPRTTVVGMTGWPDLLHYVLGNEDRTRRAVRLLIPLSALGVVLVVGVVVLAVAVPSTSIVVASGLVAPCLAASVSAVRIRRLRLQPLGKKQAGRSAARREGR